MAAGVTIKHKRKAGAFVGGELAAGEFGVDVSNNDVYTSSNGTTVYKVNGAAGAVDTANSPNANEFARFTDADTIEGRTVSETKSDLSLNNVDNTSDANKPVSTAQQTALDLKANLASPTFTGTVTIPTPSAGDSSTKAASTAFVQGEIASANLGLQKRTTVRAATTASITISTALNNGDSLDGVSLVTGDLVLVKNQAAPEQNGIYVVGAVPARSAQYDTYDEHAGAIIIIQEGSTNADTVYFSTSNVGGTLDTTAISFTKLVIAGELLAANNLLDVANASTARSNLGTNDAANITTGDIATARMQTNLKAALEAVSQTFNSTNTTIDGGSI
jgi:hypothetical protein